MERAHMDGAPMLKLTAVLAISAMLTGCVLVVGPEGSGRDEWVHDRSHSSDSSDRSTRAGDHATTSDRGIRDSIRESMAADPLLRDAGITVAVSRGEVTLHGRVSDLAQFDRAVEIATAADGVEGVVSRLVVEVR